MTKKYYSFSSGQFLKDKNLAKRVFSTKDAKNQGCHLQIVSWQCCHMNIEVCLLNQLFVYISVMQPAVIFYSKTTSYRLFELMKHKTLGKSNSTAQFESKKSTLCSRNFKNVKLWLDFAEVWWFYCHSDFAWNQILAISNGTKMSFLAILETLNFEFLVNLGLESCSNLLKSKFRTSKIAKNDSFGLYELTKIWFHVKSEWQ